MALSSGVFTRLHTWVTDRNNSVKITASRMDAEFDGIATALSTALYRDGQQVPTANLPMGGFKLTGLGDATVATDAMNRQSADARYLAISTAAADLAALLDEGVHATSVVASAATCDIGAAATDRVNVTGATTITSFGTDINAVRFLFFTGAMILTHNATTLILPTGANITTAVGDCAIFMSDSSGNWRCHHYQRASGLPLTADVTKLPLAGGTMTGTLIAPAVSIVSDGNTPLEIRATAGGSPFIDFTNDAVTDNDIRFIMTGNDTFDIQGLSTNGLTVDGSPLLSDANLSSRIATQADLEAASSNVLLATPGRIKNHPLVAKGWVSFTGATGAIVETNGASSVTRSSTGVYTVNLSVAMATTTFPAFATGSNNAFPGIGTLTTATIPILCVQITGAGSGAVDPTRVNVVWFGDLP